MIDGITALTIARTATQIDLTPSIEVDNLNFPIGQSRDFVVDLFEILGTSTTGTVTFRIAKPSGWDITVPGITLTSTDQAGVSGTSNVSGGTPNENGKWLFRQNSGFIFITLNGAYNIPANGAASIGFTATRKAGTFNNTSQSLSVTIVTGTGGDIDATNNLTSITLTAN